MKPKPPWEEESGVRILRLYRTKEHPDWPKDVNKPHLHPDWPRVVLLDLTAEQFKDFDQDPLAFTKKHKVYPEQPLQWMSCCAKPPIGKGIPRAKPSSRWLVVMPHGKPSIGACAACPQSIIGCKEGC